MFSGRTELKIVLKGLERQIKCALEHDRNLDRGKWKNLDVKKDGKLHGILDGIFPL